MIGSVINRFLKSFNLKLSSAVTQKDIDLEDDEFRQLYGLCKEYTMTSVEDLYSLYNSVKYILDHNIEGDFVECGVWKGGSAMLIAKYLEMRDVKTRKIYLYDTFSGMTDPGKFDVDLNGKHAKDVLKNTDNKNTFIWAFGSLEEVRNNIDKTSFSAKNVIIVEGDVKDTIPEVLPQKIALLRLDTDWYASTKHELTYLFPIVSHKGVLILDDHGHWLGARKAAIEYFEDQKECILLNKVSYSTRIAIKCSTDTNS